MKGNIVDIVQSKNLLISVILICSLFTLTALFCDDNVAWQLNGIVVCDTTDNQTSPEMIIDGSGGVIITWADNRKGDHDIYAQKINSSGVAQWMSNGVVICDTVGNQTNPKLASDGAGGAIIVWVDERITGDYNIYVQRINSAGTVQAVANGTMVCTSANQQVNPKIISDGSGGAFIAWEDYRTSANMYDVWAQRTTGTCSSMWAVNGIQIANTAATVLSNQINIEMISDNAGGFYVTWQDYRAGNWDIYAQRVLPGGTVSWAANGVVISNPAGDQIFPKIVPDSAGGAIIVWQDFRSLLNYDIYSQRINSAGTVQWTANGIYISNVVENQSNPVSVSDGNGGAMIAWQDYRNGNTDIYCQDVSILGVLQWALTGVAVCTSPSNQINPNFGSDASGMPYIVWEDYRNGNADIYCQRINTSGSVLYQANGITICTATANQGNPRIAISDASGAPVMVWEDYRSGSADIFANKLFLPVIGTITPSSGKAGTAVTITGSGFGSSQGNSKVYFNGVDAGTAESWSSSSISIKIPELATTGKVVVVVNGYSSDGKDFSVVVIYITSVSPSQAYPGSEVTITGSGFGSVQNSSSNVVFANGNVSSIKLWSDSKIVFNVPSDVSIDSGDVYVSAGGYASNSKSLQIVYPPRITTKSLNNYLVGNQVSVTIQAEQGVAPYKFEIVSGRLPNGINLNTTSGELYGSPTESGKFVFIIKVTDQNGVSVTQDYTWEISPKTFEEKCVVRKNLINPLKGESSIIQFKVEQKSSVVIRIYDEIGVFVKTLVDREYEAGTFSETWNGKNSAENVVPSGVYLVSVRIGSYSQVKKVVVIK